MTTSGSHGSVVASPTEGTTGTEVTLSNTPDTHYHFDSYTITGATLKNANQFDIVNSDVSVVGNFLEDTKYTVTCTNDGHGTVAASPTSNYSGSTVTLSNTPNSGYEFDSYTIVSGTGASISGNTLTIGTSNVTVRGNFAQGASVVIGGRTYRTVTINGVTWLAQNLDYGSSGVYYNNDESTYGWNGLKYGKLYTWTEAVAAGNAISGWHLPTTAEWDALANAVGGTSVAGTKLKSTTGWYSGNGTDDYGFKAFPAGYQYTGSFNYLGSRAYFWTASEFFGGSSAYYRYFEAGASMNSSFLSKNENCLSVRLVKDS